MWIKTCLKTVFSNAQVRRQMAIKNAVSHNHPRGPVDVNAYKTCLIPIAVLENFICGGFSSDIVINLVLLCFTEV